MIPGLPALQTLDTSTCSRRISELSSSPSPMRLQNGDVLNNRKARGTEQRLHNVFIHACGRTQHARPHVSDVSEFEKTLDGPIFAERAMQHGKDHVDINCAVAGAPREC